MRALRPSISSQDREAQIRSKVKITFGNDFWTTTVLDHGWWAQLESLLCNAKPHLRVCWLRTIRGGWTTSIRMHDDVSLQCIFGCQFEDDCMMHYLICPILWQLVIQFLDGEDSILLSQRLCLQSPSIKKLQRLALACRIYHACKNDCVCIKSNVVASPHTVQSRGAEFARAVVSFF